MSSFNTFCLSLSPLSGSQALPSNMANFGCSQDEEDLEDEDEIEEKPPSVASTSCQSTPKKGKPSSKINGFGKNNEQKKKTCSKIERVCL